MLQHTHFLREMFGASERLTGAAEGTMTQRTAYVTLIECTMGPCSILIGSNTTTATTIRRRLYSSTVVVRHPSRSTHDDGRSRFPPVEAEFLLDLNSPIVP